MFRFIFVNSFFLFIWASRCVVLFEVIDEGISHFIDEMVLTITELAAYTGYNYFAEVVIVCLPFSQTIRLFLLSEQFNSEFTLVQYFLPIGTEFQQFLAVKDQGWRPGVWHL